MAGSPNSGAGRCIYRGHQGTRLVFAIAWSPAGDLIASSSATSGHVPGRPLGSVSVRISPMEKVRPLPRIRERGERVDDRVHIWHAETGRRHATYRGHTQTVTGLDFSARGDRIASCSDDGTVHIWDPRIGRPIWRRSRNSPQLAYRDHLYAYGVMEFARRAGLVEACAVRWSRDGTRVASVGSHDARIWEAATGRTITTVQRSSYPGTRTIEWSADGRSVAFIAVGSIRFYDSATGDCVREIDGGDPWAVAWSSTDDIAAAGREIRIGNLRDGGELRPLWRPERGLVQAIAWSPGGNYLASAGPDNAVRIWDARSGRQMLTYDQHDGWVRSLAWSPDGSRIASGGTDQQIHVWATGLRS